MPSKKWSAMGPGYDEFVPELIGLHRADGARVYVSDGGHYDNLGLLALLRARCSQIWCVDSQADKHGRAAQLQQAIALARDELDLEIELDVGSFKESDGVLGAAYAVGSVAYPGNQIGQLIVVKLGLTAESPPELVSYRSADRRFPHHPTWIQWYGHERFRAYRRLGTHNARLAMAAVRLGEPDD
jgi:hypothetical protein